MSMSQDLLNPSKNMDDVGPQSVEMSMSQDLLNPSKNMDDVGPQSVEGKCTAIRTAIVQDEKVVVHFANSKILTFEDCWLRDHCRCTKCYHADTYQRAQHILDIPDSKIIKITCSTTNLTVEWDDGHVSTYDAGFLHHYDYSTWFENGRLKPQLWSGKGVADKVSRVHVHDFLNSVESAKVAFQSLLDYGVVLIEGVGASLDETEPVCQALGGVQHTIFGGMWEFTTRADHADTAYTSLPLAAHQDNTYFTEAAGLQILHCLEHTNGTGGLTLLADGFYGATLLKEEHPEDFHFLTKFDVEAEYIEKGHHHKFSAPVIQLNATTGDLKQIRFNVYDRSPMAFASSTDCRTYYRSLRRLARYYENVENQWRFKLKPGTVLAFDNFRILHGRTEFTGKRVLCGSYVARSDWLDKARALKLIQ